jgi:hypothetical protein
VPTQVPGHSPARIGSAGAGRTNDDKRGARGGSTKWAASEHVGTGRGWEGLTRGRGEGAAAHLTLRKLMLRSGNVILGFGG